MLYDYLPARQIFLHEVCAKIVAKIPPRVFVRKDIAVRQAARSLVFVVLFACSGLDRTEIDEQKRRGRLRLAGAVGSLSPKQILRMQYSLRRISN